LQPEVLKIHLKNIDDALDMIAATKNYPEAAQFKWNIESLWAVEHWLKQANPQQKAAFVQAVKDGSICLSALYANIMTGLSLPEEMFHYTDYAAQLRKEYGFAIPSAMISDVPGYTWATVTAMAKGGVKYFSSGPNFLGENHPYLGDRVGHFVRTWGDKPVYWQSPSGEEKILFWTGGKGYSSWHGTAPGAIFDRGAKKIAAYLEELSANKYPYKMVQWRYNVVADNGPVDTAISRFVKEWNEKYASPKIILNTPDRLFAAFEQQYGKDLPTVSGDITPYWEDGAGSTAQEEGQNRVNSLRLQQVANAYAILAPKRYDPQSFYEAWTNILMFHEHTWGAHNSITQPDVDFVTEQWKIKKQFMLDGDQQTNVLNARLMEGFSDKASQRIAVVNTHSWPATGPVEIQVAGASVKDAKGKILPLQQLRDGKYVFIAENVPPFGSAVYTVSNTPAPAATSFRRGAQSLSNGHISLTWDAENGSITQLSGPDGHNFAGSFRDQGLNSYWYVPGQDPAEAQTAPRLQVSVLEEGPVVTVISLKGEAPGAQTLEKKIILYAGAKEAVIENTIDKKPIRTKEAVHFGFPFGIPAGETTLDAGYGTMRYLKDQLPGSNMDVLYGRRWLDVSDATRGVQWMLLQTPMLEPGAMIDERLTIAQSHKEWRKEGKPTSTWFAYVMNNYWHTNYKADQEGTSHYRYALRPHGVASGAEMEKAASVFTQPFLSFPLKAGVKLPGSLFSLSNPAIIATSITPQPGGSLMVRLFNPEKNTQQTHFQWGSLQPSGIQKLSGAQPLSAGAEISLPGMGVHEYIILP
uniref:glycoside hydrolase family 38 C-terminal domain-containing protein n=2 Tax=Chitinophaga TaxID=79328 RepID=UPI002626A7CC